MSNTAKVYDFSAAHERRSNRMENQKTGYIPLYRSILKQSWAKDVYLRTLWENLLLNAARKPYKVNFKGHEWHLKPGQLVVTAADLGLQLCDRHGKPASRDQVERMLQVFVKEGTITIDGEKQKGRVITITNYHEYAQKIDNSPAHEAAHEAAHDEASNGAAFSVHTAHEAAQTTAHHEQEGINKNINNKNIMSESVRTKCEKSSGRHEETDKAFEEIFWCAGMRKAGKKNAASAFRTQFREWRKTTRGTASEFATMLAEDIACRNGKQFGFDRLLPSSYLNGQRWNDEKPETIQPQSKPSSAITVSKTGYVFFDR
ncbi:hypothetical protein E3343_03660 [Salmonella enterica subsp. enterica serovar Manhattan]|nr:hypothetical protein [Salmonella enterica subsp. enterica serovar Manhattan]